MRYSARTTTRIVAWVPKTGLVFRKHNVFVRLLLQYMYANILVQWKRTYCDDDDDNNNIPTTVVLCRRPCRRLPFREQCAFSDHPVYIPRVRYIPRVWYIYIYCIVCLRIYVCANGFRRGARARARGGRRWRWSCSAARERNVFRGDD